jgi:hypothetical protein
MLSEKAHFLALMGPLWGNIIDLASVRHWNSVPTREPRLWFHQRAAGVQTACEQVRARRKQPATRH